MDLIQTGKRMFKVSDRHVQLKFFKLTVKTTEPSQFRSLDLANLKQI